MDEKELEQIFKEENKERHLLEKKKQKSISRYKMRYGYCDGIDFQHELGETATSIYASPKELQQQHPCAATSCGIFRVRVYQDKIICRQDLSVGNSCFDPKELDPLRDEYWKAKENLLLHLQTYLQEREKGVVATKNRIALLQKEIDERPKSV
jgi:hypothetical protein